MTIWGTFVFAKPLGRCVSKLRDALPAEHEAAMNRLIQTLDEYLQATDPKARDVFRKAVGIPTYRGPLEAPSTPWPIKDPISDEEIRAIMDATCSQKLSAEDRQELLRFSRAIEARVRGERSARDDDSANPG